MSDSERLEQIKISLTFDSLNLCNAPRLKNFNWPYKQIHESDLAWLFEQAERTENLVTENLEIRRGYQERSKRVQELEKDKMRLRRALKHITVFPTHFSHEQHSKRALKISRKVLKGISS